MRFQQISIPADLSITAVHHAAVLYWRTTEREPTRLFISPEARMDLIWLTIELRKRGYNLEIIRTAKLSGPSWCIGRSETDLNLVGSKEP